MSVLSTLSRVSLLFLCVPACLRLRIPVNTSLQFDSERDWILSETTDRHEVELSFPHKAEKCVLCTPRVYMGSLSVVVCDQTLNETVSMLNEAKGVGMYVLKLEGTVSSI